MNQVTIVGAGLGGLTLARILSINNFDCQVYDLDMSATARAGGGMLDIHENSGQAALAEAELLDEFKHLVFEGSESLRILDKDGVTRYADSPDGNAGQRPEVDRGELRNMLLRSLPAGSVHWNSKLAQVTKNSDGSFTLMFENGKVVQSALLIGADGAWSKVRKLLSAEEPAYTGMTFFEGYLKRESAGYKDLAPLVGNGSLYALAEGKGLLVHAHAKGYLSSYVALKTKPVERGGAQLQRSDILKQFEDWSSLLLPLITQVSELIPRPIYAMPIGFTWESLPNCTLIGDAAHLMSPSAGEGANMAMLDAAELARAIIDEDTIEQAIQAYENKMFARSQVAAAESARNQKLIYGPDAPKGIISVMGHA